MDISQSNWNSDQGRYGNAPHEASVPNNENPAPAPMAVRGRGSVAPCTGRGEWSGLPRQRVWRCSVPFVRDPDCSKGSWPRRRRASSQGTVTHGRNDGFQRCRQSQDYALALLVIASTILTTPPRRM
jgi:hypothetical protein